MRIVAPEVAPEVEPKVEPKVEPEPEPEQEQEHILQPQVRDAAVNTEVDYLKEKAAELQTAVARARKREAQASSEAADLRLRVAGLEQEILTGQSKLGELEQEMSTKRSKIAELEKELSRAGKALDQLKAHAESTLANVNKEAEGYAEKIASYEQRAQEDAAHIGRCEMECAASQEEASAALARAAYFEDGLGRVLSAMSSGHEESQVHVVEIITGLLSGSDAFDALATHLSDATGLRGRIDSLHAELESYRKALERAKVEARTNAEMGKQAELHLAKSLSAQAAASEELHRKVLLAEKERLAAKLEYSEAKDECCALKDDLDEKTREAERLADELRAAKATAPDESFEEVMREEMMAMKAGYERRIADLRTEVKSARRGAGAQWIARASEMEKKALLAQSKVRGLEAALDAARERVMELLKA